MSWKFTKDTTKYAYLPPNAISALLNNALVFYFSTWFYANSLSAGTNANRMFSSSISDGVTGFAAGQNDDLTVYAGARSVSTDGFQKATTTKTYPLNTWHHLLAIVNISGDEIVLFVDGQFEVRTSVTFGNSVYTNGVPTTYRDFFGSDPSTSTPASTTNQWNGFLQDMGFFSIPNALTPLMANSARLSSDLFYKKKRPVYSIQGRSVCYPYYTMNTFTAAGRQAGSSNEGNATLTIGSDGLSPIGLGTGIPMRYRPTMRAVLNSVASGSLIKAINGLANASVKTVDGLANASMKTFDGLSNV